MTRLQRTSLISSAYFFPFRVTCQVVYDREVKRELYQAAGVGEYWLLDADHEAIEFYQWIEGVYQRQYPDEQGRYRVSSIPGLTVLPNQLWMDRDDRPFPPEAQFFEVAVDAPTVAPSCAQGDGLIGSAIATSRWR